MGEHLSSYSEGEKGYKEKLKQWGRIGVAGAVLFYGGIAEQQAKAQSPVSLRATAEKSLDSIPKQTVEVTEAEVRKGLLTDKTEQSFFQTDLDHSGDLKRIGLTKDMSSFISDEDVERVVRENPGVKEIILLHTHELESYRRLLSDDVFYAVRERRREPVPMPPSTADYLSIAYFQKLYEGRGIVFKGKVIALNGEFTYTVDPSHSFFKEYRKFQETLKKQYLKDLTESDKETMRALRNQGLDDRLILSTLSDTDENDPQFKEKTDLAEKLENWNDKLEEKYGNVFQASGEIEMIISQIVRADPKNKTEIRQLIGRLRQLCANNGIMLDYREM